MYEEKNNYIEKLKKYKKRAILFFILASMSAIMGGLVVGTGSGDMAGMAILYFLPFIGIFYFIFLYNLFVFISTSMNMLKGGLIFVALAIIACLILTTFVFWLFVVKDCIDETPCTVI